MQQIVETEIEKTVITEAKRRRKETEKEKEKKKKQKKKKKESKIMDIKKVAEKQKIWDEKEIVVKSEAKVKKLVSERFYKGIKVFRKKVSERMLTRKIQNHAIDLKNKSVLRKGKVYLLSKEEKKEVRKFIQEQTKKGYIQLSKSPQTVLIFFVEKKNREKKVQDYHARCGSHWGGSPQDRLRDVQTLQNNLGFSLCVMLSVCHIVTTSDKRKKSEIGVSADWYVAVEY